MLAREVDCKLQIAAPTLKPPLCSFKKKRASVTHTSSYKPTPIFHVDRFSPVTCEYDLQSVCNFNLSLVVFAVWRKQAADSREKVRARKTRRL